jgi:transposase
MGGANLLAMLLFKKFGQHQPLNRQAERYAREGVDRSLSTLADQVGTCAVTLEADPKLITQNQSVAFNQSIEMPSWQTRSAAQTSDFVGFE